MTVCEVKVTDPKGIERPRSFNHSSFLPIADRIESGTYLLCDGACGNRRDAYGCGRDALYGQEINGETFAICKADLLLNTKAVVEALDAFSGFAAPHSTFCAVVFLTAEIQQLASNTILPVDGGSANMPPEIGTGWKSGLRFSNLGIADNPSDKRAPTSALPSRMWEPTGYC